MRGFLGKATPGMIANSGPQLLVVAGAIIASGSPSTVSWLYFANRLIELPLGLVSVAMGTVLVRELSHAVRNEQSTMMHAQSRALELALGLALPATLGLIVLSEPIVRMLFEHGAFTAIDTTATARALMWLALGLPAHVLVKALSPAFFARDDTLTPLWATLKGLAVAVVAAFVFGRLFGVAGIAASIALGGWSSAVTLIRHGAVKFGFSIDAAARRRLPRIVAAALAMGAVLWLTAATLPGQGAQAHDIAQALVLAVLISGGIVLYGLLLISLGVISWGGAATAIRLNTPTDFRDQDLSE
jgi:putative peptidoglycan lipid II flippase